MREDRKIFSTYIGSKRTDKENKGPLLNGAIGTMQSKLVFMPQFLQVCAQVPSSSLSLVEHRVWECSITHSRGRYHLEHISTLDLYGSMGPEDTYKRVLRNLTNAIVRSPLSLKSHCNW